MITKNIELGRYDTANIIKYYEVTNEVLAQVFGRGSFVEKDIDGNDIEVVRDMVDYNISFSIDKIIGGLTEEEKIKLMGGDV